MNDDNIDVDLADLLGKSVIIVTKSEKTPIKREKKDETKVPKGEKKGRKKLVIEEDPNEAPITTRKKCEICSETFAPDADWKKVCKECYKANMKTCEKCSDDFFSTDEDKNVCRKCSLVNAKMKKCERCDNTFPIENGQDWKKICASCYKTNMKKCTGCGNGFYGPEPWKKICGTCFKKKKRLEE